MTRAINDAGRKLIIQFEGLRLKPYRDAAGFWTIGIGHLIRPGERFTAITAKEAEAILQADLMSARRAVERLVTSRLTDNQFAALVSLVFNIGASAFERSTLRRKLNGGDYAGAGVAFRSWVYARGRRLRGLARRREAEEELFNKSVRAGDANSTSTSS